MSGSEKSDTSGGGPRPKRSSGTGGEKRSPAKKKAGGQKSAKSGEPTSTESEFESLLSGRLVTAVALLFATVLIPVSGVGKLITKESPKTTERDEWVVGQRAIVHITATTADYEKLACLDARPAAGAHCQFTDEKTQFPREPGEPLDDNKKRILQPYRTTDGQLLLLAGLWAEPEVAMRLHTEPPAGVAENKLVRFVVECDLHFVEERAGTKIRWSRGEAWSDQGTAMVARPEGCKILVKGDKSRK